MAYRIETVKVKHSPMEVFLFSPAGAGWTRSASRSSATAGAGG